MPKFVEIDTSEDKKTVKCIIDTDANPEFDPVILREFVDLYVELTPEQANKVEEGWHYDGKDFTPPPPPPEPTFEELVENKRDEITNKRYEAETAGIEIFGNKIATDRESQALITGAALQATVDKDYTCQWKTQSGFVTLTAEQILGIAQAVRAHVQACFNREAELLALVDKAKTFQFTPARGGRPC